MAGRKVKPKELPEWMERLGSGHADSKHFNDDQKVRCIWVCGGCGSRSFYRSDGKSHAGPAIRDEDPQYAFAQGPCWRSREYGVKCVTPKAWRIIRHDLSPEPGPEVRSRLDAFASSIKKQQRQARKEAQS